MRLLAPLLVAATIVLFASGVAMGMLHGSALIVARRLHGPASVVWLVLVGIHVLVYLKRALIDSSEDVAPSSRASVPGASARAYLLSTAIVSGVVIGVATVPAQHHSGQLAPPPPITIPSTTRNQDDAQRRAHQPSSVTSAPTSARCGLRRVRGSSRSRATGSS